MSGFKAKVIKAKSAGIGFLFFSGILLLGSCQPDFQKFEGPDWIEGKLFQQLQSIPGTDSFQVCLKLTGYDTIVNNSNFTIFAPDNKALQDLIDNVITVRSGDSTRWPSFDMVPRHIKKIIVNSHMSETPVS